MSTRHAIKEQETMRGTIITASNTGTFGSVLLPMKAHKYLFTGKGHRKLFPYRIIIIKQRTAIILMLIEYNTAMYYCNKRDGKYHIALHHSVHSGLYHNSLSRRSARWHCTCRLDHMTRNN